MLHLNSLEISKVINLYSSSRRTQLADGNSATGENYQETSVCQRHIQVDYHHSICSFVKLLCESKSFFQNDSDIYRNFTVHQLTKHTISFTKTITIRWQLCISSTVCICSRLEIRKRFVPRQQDLTDHYPCKNLIESLSVYKKQHHSNIDFP